MTFLVPFPEVLATIDPETRGNADLGRDIKKMPHDWRTRRLTTNNGRDLIIFNERPDAEPVND